MKRRTMFSVLAIVAIVFTAYGLSAYNYRRQMPWEQRAYITPRDFTLDSVLMESGYDDDTGTYDYGDVGNYRVWDIAMTFTATLTNPETLTATFDSYNINITLTGYGSKIVSLTTTSQSWDIPVSTNGDVLIDLAWDSKDVENGSGTATIIFSTDPTQG